MIESPPVDIVDDCFKRDRFPIFYVISESTLTKEYQVICYRYGLNGMEPQTQREIAENLSISRSYVSRIEKTALRKLRGLFPANAVNAANIFNVGCLYSLIHPFGSFTSSEISNTSGSQSVSHRSSAVHVVHSPCFAFFIINGFHCDLISSVRFHDLNRLSYRKFISLCQILPDLSHRSLLQIQDMCILLYKCYCHKSVYSHPVFRRKIRW